MTTNPSSPTPVTVLTGFLGSGKTTALNALLAQPALRHTAVIINEFGEVGLDHHLVARTEEDLVLLANGCICCTVRGDLIGAFTMLAGQRAESEGAADDARGGETDGARGGAGGSPVDRVIVETTGLADPAPILHTLMSDPAVTAKYRLANVVATVDAVNAEGTLDRHAEAVKQVAVADRLLLTKTDLVDDAARDRLIRRLRAINPAADIVDVTQAIAHPETLLGDDTYDPARRGADVEAWLRVAAYEDDHEHAHDHHGHDSEHAQHHGKAHDHTHTHDRNRHDDHIKAFSIIRDQPVSWAGLQTWLDMIAGMRGDDLLRVKGIVNVIEHPDRPVVIHGVQHLFHPPAFLPAWPDADHRSRIVFITRDIERDLVEDTLRIFESRRTRR
ncbi:CobW family GTP-binding protein [Pigmentiphaga litoralis]|uniref:CobW family GTP-binding protein n=1 Tax=Pigmentiphaga litoralis TaxID=516702 RepID=UPI003B4309CD